MRRPAERKLEVAAARLVDLYENDAKYAHVNGTSNKVPLSMTLSHMRRNLAALALDGHDREGQVRSRVM